MRKNNKGRDDTLLAKMYRSNPSIQGQIYRFKRLGGLGRGRTREGGGRNESSLLDRGFWIHARSQDLWLRGTGHVNAPRMSCCAQSGTSEPRPVAPRRVTSELWVLAPTPRVQRCIYVSRGGKHKFSLKKGPNCKKLGAPCNTRPFNAIHVS